MLRFAGYIKSYKKAVFDHCRGLISQREKVKTIGVLPSQFQQSIWCSVLGKDTDCDTQGISIFRLNNSDFACLTPQQKRRIKNRRILYGLAF